MRTRPKDKAVVSESKNMLRRWSESLVENFRTHARAIAYKLGQSRDNGSMVYRRGESLLGREWSLSTRKIRARLSDAKQSENSY